MSSPTIVAGLGYSGSEAQLHTGECLVVASFFSIPSVCSHHWNSSSLCTRGRFDGRGGDLE